MCLYRVVHYAILSLEMAFLFCFTHDKSDFFCFCFPSALDSSFPLVGSRGFNRDLHVDFALTVTQHARINNIFNKY